MLICHRDQTVHGKTRKALAAPNFVSMVQTSSALVPQLYGSQQELDLLQRLVTFPCNLRLPEKVPATACLSTSESGFSSTCTVPLMLVFLSSEPRKGAESTWMDNLPWKRGVWALLSSSI